MVDRLIVQIIDDKGRLYHKLVIPIGAASPTVMAGLVAERIRRDYNVREDKSNG